MTQEMTLANRRNVLKGAASALGLSLAGCHGEALQSPFLRPAKYTDRPAMMAIGDSLYQGVRSLTFAPSMAAVSPPAQIASALHLPFVIPDLPRPILFDLEDIYRAPSPLITVPVSLPLQLRDNSVKWWVDTPWSIHEAFDNVAIGSAGIDSLYTDTFEMHWPRFKNWAAEVQVDYFPYDYIAKMWYSLNVCFTLNPLHRDEQVKRTQLDQVRDRQPKILLVNIGSNEGLFSAAFQGNIAQGTASLQASLTKMDELARRLADLPATIETIVFNSLIRPRAATNLMPADSQTINYPGDDYFPAYGPWLFSSSQPILGSAIRDFDATVLDQNDQVRALLKKRLGSRLVFVDLYKKTTNFDGKHYRDRVLPVRGISLKNLPLSGNNSELGGGLTGLDNMHPTGPGYSLIADAVLEALSKSVLTDKDSAFRGDSLLTDVPPFLHERHQEVLRLVATIQKLGGAFLS